MFQENTNLGFQTEHETISVSVLRSPPYVLLIPKPRYVFLTVDTMSKDHQGNQAEVLYWSGIKKSG